MEKILANNHAVLIATAGRAEVLAGTLASLGRQDPPPGMVVVIYAAPSDVAGCQAAAEARTIFMQGRRGQTRQYNDGLRALPEEIRLVTLLDDDIELATDYLFQAREVFNRRPEVVAADGRLLRDGKVGRSEAISIVASSEEFVPAVDFRPGGGMYGANMTVRRAVADAEPCDERILVYGFMFDVDFARRCARHGLVGTVDACRAVHLAAQSGRTSDRRRGFVQIMNSAYVMKKELISTKEFFVDYLLTFLRNNFLGMIFISGQRRIRLKRLIGNLLAISYLLRGRVEPELVEKVKG